MTRRAAGCSWTIALLALPLLAGCLGKTGIVLAPRHDASKTSALLWKDCGPSDSEETCAGRGDLEFAAYAKKAHAAIAAARQAKKATAQFESGETHVAAALAGPVEWTPSVDRCPGRTEGVLLIHGLTDSPYAMRDLGEFFADRDGRRFKDRCFLVRSILLPGHGTVPGDLSDRPSPPIDWREHWTTAVEYGVRTFPAKVSGVWLVGFSTGAALSIHQALSPGAEKIKGLILISPAVRPKSPLAILADLHRAYSWAYVKAEWTDLHDDRDPVKYESFAKHAGWELVSLDVSLSGGWLPFLLRQKGPQVTRPVFMAISCQDDTVDAPAAIDFFNDRVAAGALQKSRLVVFHGVPADPTIAKEYDETNTACKARYDRTASDRLTVIPVASPDTKPRVLDLPHIALPIAPGNEHYGERGDYRNCLHYLEAGQGKEFDDCRGAPLDKRLLGEKLKANLEFARKDGKFLIRLGFNPQFEAMTERIREFVLNVE